VGAPVQLLALLPALCSGGDRKHRGALLFYVAAQTANSGEANDLNALAFDSVAFLIGYREQSFRLLIKRMTDLLLGGDGFALDASSQAERGRPK